MRFIILLAQIILLNLVVKSSGQIRRDIVQTWLEKPVPFKPQEQQPTMIKRIESLKESHKEMIQQLQGEMESMKEANERRK